MKLRSDLVGYYRSGNHDATLQLPVPLSLSGNQTLTDLDTCAVAAA
jgi:hypothetical protein